MGVDEHLARQRGREGLVLEALGLGEPEEEQTAEVNSGEERADKADDQRGCEAFDGACAEEQQNHTGDNRGEVGVEDGREGVRVTVGESLAHVLAGAELFLGALEDEHVGIDGHTEREHDTGDTREGEHCLERGKDAEGEEEVADKADVGDEAGDEAVECAHENHQEHEGHDERDETCLDSLGAEARADNHIGDDVYFGIHLTALEDVCEVFRFLKVEVAGNRGLAAFDCLVDVGRGINLVVKDDGNLLADVGSGDAGPCTGALGVHAHRNFITAEVVEVARSVAHGLAVEGGLAAGSFERVEGVAEVVLGAVGIGAHGGLHAPAQLEVGGKDALGSRSGEDCVDTAHGESIGGKAEGCTVAGVLQQGCERSDIDGGIVLQTAHEVHERALELGGGVSLVELEVGRTLEEFTHTFVVFHTGKFKKDLAILALEHLDVGRNNAELVDTVAEHVGGGVVHAVLDLALELGADSGIV